MSLFTNFRRGFAENVRFGFSAMREHKLRSALTIVGIVVGVATVIAMVAIVTGFNNNVIGNFQAFGASRIDFKKFRDRFGPGPQTEEERRRRNLTVGDVAAIRQACPEAAAVSTLAGYFDAEIHVKNGNAEANNPYVLGVDEFYPAATAYTIGHGRFFSPAEVEHGALAVVLGSDVREAIFPREDPIGKEITVNGLRYRVVGVLDKKGEQFGYSPDNKVVLPYKTFEHQFGFQVRQEGIHISAVPRRAEDVDIVIEKATSVLRQRRRIPFDKPNDFEIDTPDQLIGQFRAITGGVSGAMILIALISLVVGGVGVMNIMLVSVTQRTREIGIRKAVGALRRDIVRQFLTEAVTLTTLGGIVGVALGLLISGGVKALVPSLPTSVPAWSVLLGLLVACAVGLFFGIYPAVKASRLDPIEALRYE
ncbi:MAG TPA: ABC transporter permease [Thermoanaerobaculia bacterium]|nr:ABC transporter permease [Thermoanaerobaculia bacterium]